MRRALACLVLTAATTATTASTATADPVADARALADRAAEAQRLLAHARAARDLLYYLSDPRGLQAELYQAYEAADRDPITGPLLRNLINLYRGRTLELATQVQALGDTATPASLSVGLGLTWDAPICRLLELSASGSGFYEDGGASAALAWGVGGCLPLPFNTISVGYRGRRDVRRSLLAVPVIDDDRNTGDTVYGDLRFYRWLSEHHQIDAGPLAMQFDWTRGDGVATSLQVWGSIAPVHWARRGKGYRDRDQTYDFMRLRFQTLDAVGAASDAPLTFAMSPLAVDGVMVGDVALGLDLGWQSAQWTTGAAQPPSYTTVHVDAAVTTSTERTTLEVHALRSLQPVSTALILDEHRLTGRLDLARAAAWLRLDGFLSRARLRGAAVTTDRAWTWGAGGDFTMLLTDHLSIYVRAEGARNVVVDPGPISTRFELRGTAGVTADYRSKL
jgi:hypothetical protein